MTFVLVGAGPTGVEMASAIAVMVRTTLGKNFRQIDPKSAQIILFDMAKPPLGTFSESLSEAARQSGAGTTETVTLTQAASGGWNGTAQLSCGAGVPAGYSCRFSPASVTGAGHSTLTVQPTTPALLPAFLLLPFPGCDTVSRKIDSQPSTFNVTTIDIRP
jgi:hypothetical protein